MEKKLNKQIIKEELKYKEAMMQLIFLEELIVKRYPFDDFRSIYYNNISFFERHEYLNKENMDEENGIVWCNDGVYVSDNENLIDDILQYLANKVNLLICSCEQCSDSGDIFAGMRSFFDEEGDNVEGMIEGLNTAICIEDLVIDELGYEWEDYIDELAKKIYCKCRNGYGIDYDDKIDYGTFNRYTEVFTEREENEFNHKFYGNKLESYEIVSDIEKNFSIDDLYLIEENYLKKRFYISNDKLFSRLEKVVEYYYKNNYWYTLFKGRILYRTRLNQMNQLFSKEKMWNPPFNLCSQGRFNENGQSVLYLANNKKILMEEVPKESGKCYNVAEFKIKKDFKLLPINYLFGFKYKNAILGSVSSQNNNDSFKKIYIIGNIISIMAYNKGFDGIVYVSTKDDISTNYALFDKFKKYKDIDILSVYPM